MNFFSGSFSPVMPLVVTGMLFMACSGLPGLLLSRRDGVGQKVATLLMLTGAVSGVTGALMTLLTKTSQRYVLAQGCLLGGDRRAHV